jgi:hypothetical protein
MSVQAFNVWAGSTNYGTVVNALTAGQAKAEYLRDVRDCWPDVKFTDIRARKLGPAQTSEAFLRTARYRGMPYLRCGDHVTVDGRHGFIVGHNDSANFDVLFDEGDWKGCVLNCHPHDIRRTAPAGG